MPYSTTTLSGTPSLKHDTSETNISQARDEFATLLGREAIISSPDECFARSNTRWSSASPSQIADLILFPTKTSDVSAIMRICSQRRIPVTAYSGGTSFHGALAATRRGICIDFKQMNQIISVHAEDMDVVVQPAVGWQDLNDHLNGQGLFFPPDPGPGAQIGGMVSFRWCDNKSRSGALTETISLWTVPALMRTDMVLWKLGLSLWRLF